MIAALDHVQVAMPAGGEERARGFYSGLLGLDELEKPAAEVLRGGPVRKQAGVYGTGGFEVLRHRGFEGWGSGGDSCDAPGPSTQKPRNLRPYNRADI